MTQLGKMLLFAGLGLAALGGLLLAVGKLGLHKLPGDVLIQKGNFTFYAPLGLMILLSILGTLLLNLLMRR